MHGLFDHLPQIKSAYCRIHPHTAPRTLPSIPRVVVNPYAQDKVRNKMPPRPIQPNRDHESRQPNWDKETGPQHNRPDFSEDSGSWQSFSENWVGDRPPQYCAQEWGPPLDSPFWIEDPALRQPYPLNWDQNSGPSGPYSPDWGYNSGPPRRDSRLSGPRLGPARRAPRPRTSPWVEDRRAATGPRDVCITFLMHIARLLCIHTLQCFETKFPACCFLLFITFSYILLIN